MPRLEDGGIKTGGTLLRYTLGRVAPRTGAWIETIETIETGGKIMDLNQFAEWVNERPYEKGSGREIEIKIRGKEVAVTVWEWFENRIASAYNVQSVSEIGDLKKKAEDNERKEYERLNKKFGG